MDIEAQYDRVVMSMMLWSNVLCIAMRDKAFVCADYIGFRDWLNDKNEAWFEAIDTVDKVRITAIFSSRFF